MSQIVSFQHWLRVGHRVITRPNSAPKSLALCTRLHYRPLTSTNDCTGNKSIGHRVGNRGTPAYSDMRNTVTDRRRSDVTETSWTDARRHGDVMD